MVLDVDAASPLLQSPNNTLISCIKGPALNNVAMSMNDDSGRRKNNNEKVTKKPSFRSNLQSDNFV